jgi:alpha-D-xyloside xylohydrolase
MRKYCRFELCLIGLLFASAVCSAQLSTGLVLDRKGETIVLEPYAANIVRVTISLQREDALGKPGYGFVGAPDAAGWTSSQTDLNDIYQSSRMTISV